MLALGFFFFAFLHLQMVLPFLESTQLYMYLGEIVWEIWGCSVLIKLGARWQEGQKGWKKKWGQIFPCILFIPKLKLRLLAKITKQMYGYITSEWKKIMIKGLLYLCLPPFTQTVTHLSLHFTSVGQINLVLRVYNR